jgi:hypothetical protein
VGAVNADALCASAQDRFGKSGILGGLEWERDHNPRIATMQPRAKDRLCLAGDGLFTLEKARFAWEGYLGATAAGGAEQRNQGIEGGLNVGFAATKRRQPARHQAALERSQIMAPQCQIERQVVGGRLEGRALDARSPIVEQGSPFRQHIATQIDDGSQELIEVRGDGGRRSSN